MLSSDDFVVPGQDSAHFCQPKVDAIGQNGGQLQLSVFRSDVIIFEVGEMAG